MVEKEYETMMCDTSHLCAKFSIEVNMCGETETIIYTVHIPLHCLTDTF